MRTVGLMLILVVVCGWSCERRRPPAQEEPVVVAEYRGGQITKAELDAAINSELYRLRAESLHHLLIQRLERIEADRQGLSISRFRDKEIDSRVPVPTEEQMLKALADAVEAGTVPEGTTLDAVRDRLSNFMTTGLRRQAKEEYVDKLLVNAEARLHLDVLGRPNVPFRQDGPSAGPESAAVTIVEYTDFNAQFTAMGNDTVKQILREYPDHVRVLFKHKPADDDEVGLRAAEAALCAHAQGRYWDYRELLFKHQDRLEPEQLVQHAEQMQLDLQAFRRCFDERTQRDAVQADMDEAARYGLRGSPVFSVNGTPLSGAHSFSTFRRLIELELPAAKPDKPGVNTKTSLRNN